MSEQDPFISVSDLEAWLDETIVDPNSLAVKITLDSACQKVRTYIGQTINLVEDDVEVHSGSGRRKLRLRERPVRSVSEVKIDDEVMDPSTYNVRDAIITFIETDYWWNGDDNIYVTYTHGYDIVEPSDFNVPADMRLVALLLAARIYQNIGVPVITGGVSGETIGDYSYTVDTSGSTSSAIELYDAEKYCLDRYRIDLVGDTPTQWM